MILSALQPVPAQDLNIGIPLAYPIYDEQTRLLLREGQIIRNEKHLTQLSQNGIFRNVQHQPPAAPTRNKPVLSNLSRYSTRPRTITKPSRHLAQVRLQPNAILHAQRLDDAQRIQVSLRLIGWLDKAGVLISNTNPDGIVLPFQIGEQLKLKTIVGKEVVAFQSRVEQICSHPFPYLHLSWPDQLEIHQLRNSFRVQSNLIVSISTKGRASLPAKIINLSATGAMLEGNTLELEAEQRIQITMRLRIAEGDHTLRIAATVRNCHIDPPAINTQYGIEFDPLAVSELLFIEHYIYHCLMK
ncbi:flagellar brake protein [Chitinibacter sp. S2-10]|uniref:flagellar brake protein n=1 Tax=Chitinibacter sp. S2-10 TaxID=3373597 RepID=UPI0039772B16